MGSFLRVRDRQPEGGSSREKEEEEWERERTNKKTNEKNEGRREKTADGTMSLASLREIPVFHSLWVGSSCRSVLPQVAELDPLEFFNYSHTQTRLTHTQSWRVSFRAAIFLWPLWQPDTSFCIFSRRVCLVCVCVSVCVCCWQVSACVSPFWLRMCCPPWRP